MLKTIPFPFNAISSLLLCVGLLLPACNTGGNEKPVQAADRPASAAESKVEKGTFTTGAEVYPTLRIGGMTWLGANLHHAQTESWCYDNLPANCEKHGRLYRWAEAKEACSALGEGWRLPAETEWRQLASAFGGYTDWLTEQSHGDPVAANRALIEGGQSGFSATLSGWRGSNGGFDSAGKMGFYWTATETSEDEAWFYIVLPVGNKLSRRSTNKQLGMACRCVRQS